jgi:hypothetical protein
VRNRNYIPQLIPFNCIEESHYELLKVIEYAALLFLKKRLYQDIVCNMEKGQYKIFVDCDTIHIVTSSQETFVFIDMYEATCFLETHDPKKDSINQDSYLTSTRGILQLVQ